MAAVDSFQFLYAEISRSCSSYWDTLALVGGLYAAGRAVVLLSDCCALLRVHFLPRIIPSKQLARRYGDWAVMYGAAEPVAAAYAEELARQGVSILFIAADQSAVRDLAASLSQSYGVETAVVELADVSLGGKAVAEAVRGKDVGFLVNCVVDEAASAARQSLIDTPERSLLDVVNRSVAMVTLVTRLVLPGMVERSRGAVVNITPGTCCRPLAGRAALTAATGYLDHFSRALQLEYGSRGIFVQSLTPFQVASSSRPLSSAEGWFVPKPDVYARHAVSTLGVSHRTTGYWPHTLQYGLISCVPDWIWLLGSRIFISSS